MKFTELAPEIALQAIEGQQSIFHAEQERADAFYRQFICPSCKSGSLVRQFNARHAFADRSWLIARATLKCAECKCHFDPHTGLILEMGNPALVNPHIPSIKPSDD